MTYQTKQDLKFCIMLAVIIMLTGFLTGCATLRDYSEWKNKRDAGCGYCCPPAFGNVFTEAKK